MGPEGQVHTVLVEQLLQTEDVYEGDTISDLKSVTEEFTASFTCNTAFCLT